MILAHVCGIQGLHLLRIAETHTWHILNLHGYPTALHLLSSQSLSLLLICKKNFFVSFVRLTLCSLFILWINQVRETKWYSSLCAWDVFYVTCFHGGYTLNALEFWYNTTKISFSCTEMVKSRRPAFEEWMQEEAWLCKEAEIGRGVLKSENLSKCTGPRASAEVERG